MKPHLIIKIMIIFILLLGLPSFLSLAPSLYYSEAEKTDANETLEDAEAYYENVRGFLNNREPLREEFTELETKHMQDVKFLFNLIRSITIVFLVAIIIYTAHLYRENRKKETFLLIKDVRNATIITLIIIATLTALVLINFSTTFDVFHYVFFPQGNWTFPYTSLLITLFPETFFMNLATKIMIATLTITIILGTVLTIKIRKTKKTT